MVTHIQTIGTAADSPNILDALSDLVVRLLGERRIHIATSNPDDRIWEQQAYYVRRYMKDIQWTGGELYTRLSGYENEPKVIETNEALPNHDLLPAPWFEKRPWYSHPKNGRAFDVVEAFLRYHSCHWDGRMSLELQSYERRGRVVMIVDSTLEKERYVPVDSSGCSIPEVEIQHRDPRSIFVGVYQVGTGGLQCRRVVWGEEPYKIEKRLVLRGKANQN